MNIIVIDPYQREIRTMDAGGQAGSFAADKVLWERAKALIFAQGPNAKTDRQYLEIMHLGEGIMGLIDEEGALAEWREQAFFRFGDNDDLAGVCVLVGDGKLLDAPAADSDIGEFPDFADVPHVNQLMAYLLGGRVEWRTPEQAQMRALTITVNGVVDHPHGPEPYSVDRQPGKWGPPR
jgi:hypothetical protein